MATIKFERFERDCQYNERCRKDGGRFIYDYRVMIDGEFRAVLSRDLGNKYELYDAEHRPIHLGEGNWYPKHIGSKIGHKKDFQGAISVALADNKIPTLAQLAELQQAEDFADAKAAADQREAERVRRIRAAAVDLYDVLKLALPILEGANSRCTQDTVLIQKVRSAVSKAEVA